MQLVRLDQNATRRVREYMDWCVRNLKWNGQPYERMCSSNRELPLLGSGPTVDLIKEWDAWHRRSEVFLWLEQAIYETIDQMGTKDSRFVLERKHEGFFLKASGYLEMAAEVYLDEQLNENAKVRHIVSIVKKAINTHTIQYGPAQQKYAELAAEKLHNHLPRDQASLPYGAIMLTRQSFKPQGLAYEQLPDAAVPAEDGNSRFFSLPISWNRARDLRALVRKTCPELAKRCRQYEQANPGAK